jgi:hypothetical protein
MGFEASLSVLTPVVGAVEPAAPVLEVALSVEKPAAVLVELRPEGQLANAWPVVGALEEIP